MNNAIDEPSGTGVDLATPRIFSCAIAPAVGQKHTMIARPTTLTLKGLFAGGMTTWAVPCSFGEMAAHRGAFPATTTITSNHWCGGVQCS